jgi:hypothetical protein
MSDGLPLKFPNLDTEDLYNPAIRLFGNRFYNGQSVLEYLNEFLGLIYSEKKVGDFTFTSPFISYDQLEIYKRDQLQYDLPVKLNLKLISLFGSSRIDARHKIHEKQYRRLVEKLEELVDSDDEAVTQAINHIEALFRSMVGAGFNRDWCAKNYFPLSKSLITRETIWSASKAKGSNLTWFDSISEINKYYSWAKRNFMARGGELLYLQLCNALLQSEENISKFIKANDIHEDLETLEELHDSLKAGFDYMQTKHIIPFDKLVNFIELLDSESSKVSNEKAGWQTCEWCPQESWQEGYLFAVELNRVLHATLDPIDRLEMLMTGCSLQVLRSLCAQSVRYAGSVTDPDLGGALGYAWVFSHPQSAERSQKIASQRNLVAVQSTIQKALRHEALVENAAKGPKGIDSYYKEADTKYGHKLFLSLGKKLGIIVPLKGRGARFILTDKVVRYLVLTSLPPGGQCTYEDFLKKIYSHFGIAVEGSQLNQATLWTGLPGNNALDTTSSWLAEMLRAGGFLTELSDACSIVNNPFGDKE